MAPSARAKRPAPAGKSPAGGAAQTAYLVLGMHRSGTSALAQVMALAGADLPKNVMPADRHNEKGYFEPWRIAVLNDERLRAAGAAWDDVFAYPFRPLGRRAERGWLNRAMGLFEEEYGRARRPLLKDPRITVLLPFWRDVLSDLEIDARCVIAVRHPHAVAASLERRNGFPAEKSALLWTAYMLAAEAYTRDLPRVFVSYDALLADWRGQLARIRAGHATPLPRLTPSASQAIDAFLTTNLRHNAPTGDASLPGWPGELATEAYSWFDAACRDQAPEPAALERLTEALVRRRDEVGPLVSPVTRDLDRLRSEVLDLHRRLDAERAVAEAREKELLSTLKRDRSELEKNWRNDVRQQEVERQKQEAAGAALEAELRASMARDREVLEAGWKGDVERLAQQHRELEGELQRLRRAWAELDVRLDSILAEA